MRKKRILGWLAIAGIVAAAASYLPPQPSSAPDAVPATASRPRPDVPAAESRFSALPERDTLGKRRGEVFASRSWAPAAPAQAAVAPVAAAPVPPPMPYRVAGKVVHGGDAQVVLAKGDRVLTVREGESLDGGYRVESIEPDRVTLLYVPLGVRESLPVTSTLGLEAPSAATALAPQAPASRKALQTGRAQLRWEGPRQVREGNAFDVALKVTSAQPLRALPLQLSFDAKLLEAVDVRAGDFFAGGMFSYRVNPSGSIFVGASGKGAVASDAELLVVTFRPIRSGSTAELKLSSVMLQGPGGHAIVHDRPEAFRTTIVQ